jgi:hypothetical protein
MLRATSTGEAQICGGAGAGAGVGDAVADGVEVPEVPGLAGVVPLAGWVACEDRDGAAFADGVLLPGAGSVVTGSVVTGSVVTGEDIVGAGDAVEAGVAVGAGDAAGGGASRWQAAMTTRVPDCAALPPTPLTSAK